MRCEGRGGEDCFGLRESYGLRPNNFCILKSSDADLQRFHVFMSGSTLILGVSSVPLIQNPGVNAEAPRLEGRSLTASDSDLSSVVSTAKWVVSISLSITVACQTGIALLSRSLDTKGSLKISNRYVRLLPRLVLVAIVMCVPIDQRMVASSFMGIVVSLLLICMFWEWIVSLESDGGFFEP